MKSPFMKAVVGAAVILTSPIVTFWTCPQI